MRQHLLKAILAASPFTSERAREIYVQRQTGLHKKVGRAFIVLLAVQWVAAIAFATWTRPLDGLGPNQLILDVWIAISLGGTLALGPVLLAFKEPDSAFIPHVTAAAQILLTVLLVQLADQQIEAHFYVFASVALLLLYKDWRLFVPATAAFAVGPLLRSAFSAQPMFGFLAVGGWGLAEYSWVALELAFLAALAVRIERDMRDLANHAAELEVSDAKFHVMLERAGDGICVLARAPSEILETNDTLKRTLMFDALSVAERVASIEAIVASAVEVDSYYPAYTSGMQNAEQGRLVEHRQPDGSSLTLHVTVTSIVHGLRDALCVAVRDVTDQLRTQAALRDVEERYALAGRGASDGLWDWDLNSGRVHVSTRWSEMLQLRHDAVNHIDHWVSRLHPDDRQAFHSAVQDYLDGSVNEFQHEHRIQHADGTYRWMVCRGAAVHDERGRPSRLAGSQTDVTERHTVEQQLEHAVCHDTLTGLANRSFFARLLSEAIARARREPAYTFAVLFVDLDRFKIINDSLGHLVGDELLKELAWRLTGLMRSEDIVARFGGDEFTILLDGADADGAAEVAGRIGKELETPFFLSTHEMCVSASIGIALSSPEHNHGEELLRNADIAMYRAKALGKNRYETFDAAMHQTAVARLTMESEIRRALEWHEFTLCYQPIVSLKHQTIVGFEALVRWTRRNGEKVSPSQFVPVAEETGLILPLGKWVLNEACRQLAVWQNAFPGPQPLSVAVNVAPRELEQPGFVDQVAAALRESRIAPGSLHLELTERWLVDGSEATLSRIRDLKALSVQLYLDDFGTGYSSLSYLHRFPLDVIKIDQSFIQRMEANVRDDTLVAAIITLAKKLGMGVVAEGVETASQYHQLRATECDCVQGYFLAPPRDAADIEALLQQVSRGQTRIGEQRPGPRAVAAA